MRIGEIGEFGLIELIRKNLSSRVSPPGLIKGIGDDAAVFKTTKGRWNLATVDALVENVHFKLTNISFHDLGWKALAVNISDIASMGGEPLWALVNLTVTKKILPKDILAFYDGMNRCGRKFKTRIIGGNISRSHTGFSVAVTLLGAVTAANLLQRSGAKAGDVMAVTGDLGAAHAGLKVLQRNLDPESYSRSLKKHRSPMPRQEWISTLLKHDVKVNSCIDLSDGLASDLHHLCKASKVGAEVRVGLIPCHPETKKIAEKLNETASGYTLNGGEDYELLMTMSAKEFAHAKRILKNNLTGIGVITKSKKITGIFPDGKRKAILPNGFRHF
jgi:thiamine-monophosphate kinase